MRIVLGNALLLAASSLVGLSPSPVAAATGCEAPDTTWVGTSTGSMSWADEANWSHGVPSAESVVCIPDTGAAPEIGGSTAAAANVIDASEATVTLGGDLTVGNSFEVATLVGELGDLHGPGTTTVTDRLSGPTLRLLDLPVVNLTHGAVLDGDVDAWDGSLNVVGDVVLGSARVDSLGGRPFTIAETGSLTLEGGASALIEGGFANHGQVTATSGFLRMLGASPEGLHPEHFSTGTFTGGTGANFWVVGTELGSGARLDHVNWVQGISVPADHTVTAAASSFLGSGDSSTPSVSGAGEIVVTDGSIAEAEIGGSLTVTVPEGEVFVARDSVIQDQVHLNMFGTLAQAGNLVLQDEVTLTLEGPGASLSELASLDNGPTSTLALRGGADLNVPGKFRNEGLVQLSPRSRLITAANFHQFSTGRLVTDVDATGLGRVRAEGRRNLAGELVIQRDPTYTPPVGTVMTFLSSNGRVEPDDAFDRVVSPKYGKRKLRPLYELDHVRLRVDRVG
jgi:hypothetical protein